MKLGAAFGCEDILKPSFIAKKFYENNINVVEFMYDQQFNPKEIRAIREFNLDISIHCPTKELRLQHSFIDFFLKRPNFYFKKNMINKIEKSFLVAERLDATHYIMHGGTFPKGYSRFKRLRKKEKFIDSFIRDFKFLFLKAKDSGIKIVLESLTERNIFEEALDIRSVQKIFPWAGLCLDFAHSELTNQTNFLKKQKIDHVHVSDNDLKNDFHLPIGGGSLNFVKLFTILKNQNFNGKIIAECLSIEDTISSFNRLKGKSNLF